MGFTLYNPVTGDQHFNILARHCEVYRHLRTKHNFPCVLLEGTIAGMAYRRHATAEVMADKDGHIHIKTPRFLPPMAQFTAPIGRLAVTTAWRSPFKGVGEILTTNTCSCGGDNSGKSV